MPRKTPPYNDVCIFKNIIRKIVQDVNWQNSQIRLLLFDCFVLLTEWSMGGADCDQRYCSVCNNQYNRSAQVYSSGYCCSWRSFRSLDRWIDELDCNRLFDCDIGFQPLAEASVDSPAIWTHENCTRVLSERTSVRSRKSLLLRQRMTKFFMTRAYNANCT